VYAVRITAITAAALAIRLAFLGRTALWRDEAFTGVVVRRSLGQMLDAVRHDAHPPLAYLLTRLVAVFSSSPAALRLVPALAGTAAVPLAAALARRVGGDRAGVLGAAAVAVLPSFMASSRDARMYALATTLVMAAVLGLWRALERPTPARLLALFALAALCVHTQYLVVLALLAALVSASLVLRPPRSAVLLAATAMLTGALTLLPWLIAARSQLSTAGPTWVQPLNVHELQGVASEFLAGPGIDPGTANSVLLESLQGLAIAAGVLAIVGLFAALPGMPAAQRRAARLLMATGLGGIALLAAVSLQRPAFEARYASVLWGPLAPLLGVGLARLRPRPVAAVALGTMAAAAIAVSAVLQRTDVGAAVAQLSGRVGPGDVVVAPVPEYLLVLYYGDAAVAGHAHVVAESVDAYWGVAAFPAGALIRAVPENAASVHVLSYPGAPLPPLPPGLQRRAGGCEPGICWASYAR